MTQDETFEALKRTPIHKLVKIHDEWFTSPGSRHLDDLIRSHGWDFDEYWEAAAEFNEKYYTGSTTNTYLVASFGK
jgi:hypothetical protein